MKSIEQQVRLTAAPDEVWAVVGSPGEIADWVPAIEASAMAGQIRTATFAGGGGDAREEIVARDDAGRSYTYRYLQGPLPLASYESTLAVHPDDTGSRVVWTAEFSAADEETEAGLVPAINGIYSEALGELGARFGVQSGAQSGG